MRVHLRVGGDLVDALPPDVQPTTDGFELPEPATAVDLLVGLGFDATENLLVAVNGTVVPRSQRAARALAEGDRVEVMPALKGG